MNTAAQLPLHINTYSGLIATSWQLMANISAAQKKKQATIFIRSTHKTKKEMINTKCTYITQEIVFNRIIIISFQI